MRKYTYRAKTKSKNQWVFGDLITPTEEKDNYRYKIRVSAKEIYVVNNDTICRFVDAKDRNDNDIYENDVIDCRYGLGVVKFSKEHLTVMLNFMGKVYMEPLAQIPVNDLRVVGNTFDMKELETSIYMGQYVTNAFRLKMIGYDSRTWEQMAADFGYSDKNVLLNEFVKSYPCKYRHFVIRKLREDNDWFILNR